MRVVAGKAKGIMLKAPDGLATRPTADRVKEAMFSIVQFELPGASVLDLFGGTGQLGIEAVSRGAKSAVIVDVSDAACKVIGENIKRAKMEQEITLVQSNYLSFLQSCNTKFDLILLDPPYAEEFLEKSLKMITEIDILQSGGIIIAERPLGKDLSLDFSGFIRSKDYKYGKTLVTLFRKSEN